MAWPFHLVNVLLHAGVSALVAELALRTVCMMVRAPLLKMPPPVEFAAFFAILLVIELLVTVSDEFAKT